jgi:hypothetical protein
VVVVRVKAVLLSTAVTVALGMTAPPGSETEPTILPKAWAFTRLGRNTAATLNIMRSELGSLTVSSLPIHRARPTLEAKFGLSDKDMGAQQQLQQKVMFENYFLHPPSKRIDQTRAGS